jgi:anti-sigma regulatory factor (Ser/Thr protein kinase)
MRHYQQHRHTEVASASRSIGLSTRSRGHPSLGKPRESGAAPATDFGRPRMLRMPADWWYSPSSVGCPLNCEPQAERAARQLTRRTLRDWDLMPLATDAEIIVAEFVANAVRHARPTVGEAPPRPGALSLRLIRRTTEVICAVLDPSDAPPSPRQLGGEEEAGRGLQLVGEVSDVWGWSPVAGGGKAVWAILFCAPTRADLEAPVGSPDTNGHGKGSDRAPHAGRSAGRWRPWANPPKLSSTIYQALRRTGQ